MIVLCLVPQMLKLTALFHLQQENPELAGKLAEFLGKLAELLNGETQFDWVSESSFRERSLIKIL